MRQVKVAVIMSVYKNDELKFLKESIDSIVNQSYKCIHFFIHIDGSVSKDVSDLLNEYAQIDIITVTFHKSNLGLAHRLNDGIQQVLISGEFSYIARMDADDISCYSRIEEQVSFMQNNPKVDVVGSDVQEINGLGSPLFYKNMAAQHDELMRDVIVKCPFNHPSVMFRISVFQDGYRYQSKLKNTQDYYLWIDLLAAGKIFSNINKPLLKFRLDDNFHSRRGFKKANNDVKSRFYAFSKLGNLSLRNIIHVFLLYFLRLSPSFVKKLAYEKLR
ncbi:glycosyltransferase [Vibrio sp. 10N.222.54.B6]|uniref:glycosyltransferase n=1 Tax=Vibrio sp. 10N.222.54.B6 TaxID=1884468 RepID=UPI000C835F53|nr:glycosyltransferase [Vibrio sp. 10N.222.54.B6]PMO17537.1 glycosyl transferase [Vibrio sp. 10N.222.54.B6]